MANPQEDGYIECDECGHAIEQHDHRSCQAVDGCQCPERWTVREIGQVRRENGLPARFSLSQLG